MPISTAREDQNPFQPEGVGALTLRVSDSFEEFVRLNPDLIVEQKPNGEILIMPATGGESSDRNAEITYQLRAWSKQHGGYTFDSSVIFCLPDGSKRSPDASWIESQRWLALSAEDRQKFPPISPDFVIELRSESDTVKELQDKLQCYIDNGVRLGWLIDPFKRKVYIYLSEKPVEVLESPQLVSCEAILPGFVLDLKPVWKN